MKQQQSQSTVDFIVISKRVAYIVRMGWEEGPFMLGGGIRQDCAWFHSIAQNSRQFKTYRLFSSRTVNLIVGSLGHRSLNLRKTKAWIKVHYCVPSLE